MECSDINDVFVNEKASNSALDMNFEVVDSMKVCFVPEEHDRHIKGYQISSIENGIQLHDRYE